jgi:hypothetical protein
MERATQREFVYSHPWRVGDLVMGDNRQTMHRARRFDDRNEVRDVLPHHTRRRRPDDRAGGFRAVASFEASLREVPQDEGV